MTLDRNKPYVGSATVDEGFGLMGLDIVAHVLKPIRLVVWGELAMRKLGVPTVCSSYMLGIRDNEIDLAATKLAAAGFVRQNWSFSSTVDPATRADDEIFQRIQSSIRSCYGNFDAKTIRFHHPNKNKCSLQIVLIFASYIRLQIHEAPISSITFNDEHATSDSLSQPLFYAKDNLYYPNVVVLLESFITVWLEERGYSDIRNWQLNLAAWAEYLYGDLSLRDDVLDGCENDQVKQRFNEMKTHGLSRSTFNEVGS